MRPSRVPAFPRQVVVRVHDMAHPEDCSGLARDLADGLLDPDGIRAVFIKTEGNGLDNDHSRPLALRALERLLPERDAGAPPLMRVVSGGCEGMLVPHMVVLATRAAPDGEAGQGPSLALGTCLSEPLPATALGRQAHAQLARQCVERACAEAGIAPEDVVSVQLLSPWLSAELAASVPAGTSLVATGAHASKPPIRAAAALGAALALGEVEPAAIAWSGEGPRSTQWARRVAVTAGDTGGRVQALVLGHARGWAGPLRVASAQLADMLDVQAIASVRRGELLAAFYKGDPPPAGRLRGMRTTMGSDSDIHAFRHFRAAMSGVFGAALGTPRVFIGGGAECQCAPGGGLLTAIYRQDLPA